MQRILGITMLVIGVILLIVGINASHSVVNQLSDTFTGQFTHSTAWYIYGGGAVALVGLLLLLASFRMRKA